MIATFTSIIVVESCSSCETIKLIFSTVRQYQTQPLFYIKPLYCYNFCLFCSLYLFNKKRNEQQQTATAKRWRICDNRSSFGFVCMHMSVCIYIYIYIYIIYIYIYIYICVCVLQIIRIVYVLQNT